jgi:hypothetical protein
VSRYDSSDEQKVHLQQLVREWTAAGLLQPEQRQRFDRELHVNLRRTGGVLRTGLALFTALVVLASVGLVTVFFDIKGNTEVAATCGLAGVACFIAADRLVVRFRFYRHGVEEMLAVAACVLLAIGAAFLPGSVSASFRGSAAAILALATGAASSYFVYRWFGLLYAEVGALICVALIPFQVSIGNPLQRLLSAAVFASAFVAARAVQRGTPGDEPGQARRDAGGGDDAGLLQAAAFAGTYLAANLYVTHAMGAAPAPDHVVAWFRWTTYASIWLLPVVGLWIAIREKQRALLDAGIAAALVTLISNKPYLGAIQHPWDPMLLGVVLIGIALGLRRWLVQGPGGERGGFTPQQILASEGELVRWAQTASAAVDLRAGRSPEPPPTAGFDGGRSGGGGGGAEF